jgi:hypothetical protein
MEGSVPVSNGITVQGEAKSPISLSAGLDPAWDQPVKLMFLVSPSRGRLNDTELALLNQHFTLFIYSPAVHGEKSLISIPYGTAIIVYLGDKLSKEWYTHQTRAIREDKQVRSILVLDTRESSADFLGRKELFSVHNVIKQIPWSDLPVEMFLKYLLTDVVPHIPGSVGRIGKVVGKCLCS